MQEIDELVEDWTPEPLAAAVTPFEEAENEKRPVIVGCVGLDLLPIGMPLADQQQTALRDQSRNSQTAEQCLTSQPTTTTTLSTRI